MEGNEFTMGYLEMMKVVRNYGTHWGIVNDNDDDEQPSDQPLATAAIEAKRKAKCEILRRHGEIS